MTTEPTKRITATIKEITEALGGQGGTYHKLTTPPVGQQKYPNIYKVWDSKLLEGIKTGDTVTISLSRGKPRIPDPQADKDFYWEVAGIVKMEVAPSPSGTGYTREPDPLDAELAGKPSPKPVAPTQKSDGDNKDRQIARAVALKVAVEHPEVPVAIIIARAEELEKWLTR